VARTRTALQSKRSESRTIPTKKSFAKIPFQKARISWARRLAAAKLMRVASFRARGYMNSLAQTGRYRSGQTGQTVNLLALRLRWFESSPAHISQWTDILPGLLSQKSNRQQSKIRLDSRLHRTCLQTTGVASSRRLCAGHRHADRRIRRRRNVHHRRRHHRLAAAVRADAPRSQSLDGHPWFDR
jgi:hypothetical protein